MGLSSSARAREEDRRRWRAAILPVWPTLKRRLSGREAMVLNLRLGLVSNVPLSQAQIARRLGLTANGIAAIEERAKAKIRAAVHLSSGRKADGTA